MPPKRPPEKWKPFRKGKTFGIFLEYFWIGGERKKRPKIDYFDFLLVLTVLLAKICIWGAILLSHKMGHKKSKGNCVLKEKTPE